MIRDNFNVTGYYYTSKGRNFRKYLNIRRKGCKVTHPQLMVIMMNPGDSQPLDGNDNGREEVEAKPDVTQDRIMQVMNALDQDYARVLNLSDFREKKKDKFLEEARKMDGKVSHSIFGDQRKNDLMELWVSGIPVLCAWGVDLGLKNYADDALQFISDEAYAGVKKVDSDFAYYHPLATNLSGWVGRAVNALNPLFQRKK